MAGGGGRRCPDGTVQRAECRTAALERLSLHVPHGLRGFHRRAMGCDPLAVRPFGNVRAGLWSLRQRGYFGLFESWPVLPTMGVDCDLALHLANRRSYAAEKTMAPRRIHSSPARPAGVRPRSRPARAMLPADTARALVAN